MPLSAASAARSKFACRCVLSVSLNSNFDTNPKDLEPKTQLSIPAPGSCNCSLSHLAWCSTPSHKGRTPLRTLESLTHHSFQSAKNFDTIHEGPGAQGDPMFSRPLFLTLEMPPRQILNRTNTHRVMFNMSAPEFQVLFKSLSAHLVSEPQGTKLFRFTLPVASFGKTHNRLKIDHHRTNGRHALLQHQVHSQPYVFSLSTSPGGTQPKNQCASVFPLLAPRWPHPFTNHNIHSTQVRSLKETMQQPLTVECFLDLLTNCQRALM